jgi:hypothetical protein
LCHALCSNQIEFLLVRSLYQSSDASCLNEG